MKSTTEQLFDYLDELYLSRSKDDSVSPSEHKEEEAKFQEIKRLVADYWSQYSRP